MWLSKQMKPVVPTTDADMGVTTISGDRVGVLTRGEVRSLPVYGPGGYAWMPAAGGAVLVIKGGPGGEEQYVAGMEQPKLPASMKPGEVWIYGSGGNTVYLKRDGKIELQGAVSIQGSLTVNGEAYIPCRCGEAG